MLPMYPLNGQPYTLEQLKFNAIADSRYSVEKRNNNFTSLSAEAYALAIDVLYFTGQPTMAQEKVDALIDFIGVVANLLPYPHNRSRLLKVEKHLETVDLPKGYHFPKWSLPYLIGELAAAKFLFAQAIENWDYDVPCHWNDIYWRASKPWQFNIFAPISQSNYEKPYFAAVLTDAENMEEAIARAIKPQWTS